MSQSIRPLRVAKNLDSRLTAGQGTPEYLLHQGASEITYRSFPSSNLSASSVIFNNVNPPSANTYVSRTVFVEVQYQISFTGTVAQPGTNLLDDWGYSLAPRALPVNNSFKSLTVSLNGSSFSADQNDIVPVMSRVKYHRLQSFLSQTPTVLDNCQIYSEGVPSNVNVLGSVQNGQPGVSPARGGFQGVKVVSNTPTSAVILLTAVEPLMISPLAYSDEHDHLPAFVGLSTFQAQATFDDNLGARLISISDNTANTFSSVSAIPTYSNIYFAYYSSMLIQQPPTAPVYPWHPTQRYIQAGQSLAPSATTTLSLNNIQLDSIPARMYLVMKPTRSSYNIRQTDTFARINTVNISFGTRSALLSNCDSSQLFHISKGCGVDADYNAWFGSEGSIPAKPRNFSGLGSVLAINPMKDLGLSDLATNGTSQTIQVQFQVNYTNIQPLGEPSLQYDAYLVIVSDGIITIPGPGVCLQQQSITSQTDLLNAPMVMVNPDVYGSSMSGGSFWSDIGDWFKNPQTWKDAWKLTKQIAPYVAPLVGLGLNEPRGSSLVGGKRISKQKLLSLMH